MPACLLRGGSVFCPSLTSALVTAPSRERSVLVSGEEAKQYIISQRSDGGRAEDGGSGAEGNGFRWPWPERGARDSRQTCHKKSKLQQQIQWKGFPRFEMTGGRARAGLKRCSLGPVLKHTG